VTNEQEQQAIDQALKALYARGVTLGLPRAMLDRVSALQVVLHLFYPNVK